MTINPISILLCLPLLLIIICIIWVNILHYRARKNLTQCQRIAEDEANRMESV